MTDVADYLQRIAAEHSDKPDYLQSVTVSLQPGVDGQNLLAGMTRADLASLADMRRFP